MASCTWALSTLAARTHIGWILSDVIAACAVALGAINVVGGFVVTDRILGMFHASGRGRIRRREGPAMTSDQTFAAYLATSVLFIYGMMRLRSPLTARTRQPHRRDRYGRCYHHDLAIDNHAHNGVLIVVASITGRLCRRCRCPAGAHDGDATDGRVVQRHGRRGIAAGGGRPG